MNDLSIEQSYNLGAAGYSEAWTTVHPWLLRARTEVEVYLRPGMKALEIGFGAGRDLAYLSSLGLLVTGIDISPEMVRLGQETYPNLALVCGDFRTAHLPLGAYDLVWASYSLLHVPPAEFDAALLRISELLTKAGLLFVTMSIAADTVWRFVPVAGLVDSSNQPVPVWNASWNLRELEAKLSMHFQVLWSEAEAGGLPGRILYAGIWRKLH